MPKLVIEKHLSPFQLFPVKPGACPECSVKHAEQQPHYKDSLYYKYRFYNEHGRCPNWADAMAHCDEDVQEYWKTKLTKCGVKKEELTAIAEPKLIAPAASERSQ